MATIVLSAAGAAVGGAIGGGVLGLSSAVIGRSVGATIGQAIDQKILGGGSQAVATGRVDRFRLTSASEGTPVARIYGRTRVSGQVIWASNFREHSTSTRQGGKGGGPRVTSYSYSVSFAVALCAGEIVRVGRVWADGKEIGRDDLTLRVYTGVEDQLPDPKIEAVEGAGKAPAYRGTAYVVIEDLDLTPFGNRVPQFSFEVMRPEQPDSAGIGLSRGIRAVAMMPGTGEYALATTSVTYNFGPGVNRSANRHSPGSKTDFATSLEALGEELPNCGSVSLIVSWFGGDLRCGSCTIAPKVEQNDVDGTEMPWAVSGIGRSQAEVIARDDGRPIYGGTPTDRSVVEAIAAMREAGIGTVFYPFLLMDQLGGNGLPNPLDGAAGQPALPWRGRITVSLAPGQPGSPDGTADAEAEIAAFFGEAEPSDFVPTEQGVTYIGPEEFSYRRFVLHYAHLCAAAGGVEAFCIGSEMRSLTQVRGPSNSFPAVAAFRRLAADVRAILGADVKIGYAADWSEYFGYHPDDGSGDVFFHLDPLWADETIDFIGIDNYMPLSDWREGFTHADADRGSIYDLEYLKANVAGGEGYDWYYSTPEAEAEQLRSPIADGLHGEDWIFRYKDIRNWWSRAHHDRVGGQRSAIATEWRPRSKPVWFTEFGCAAIDKGANEPNKFLDPKSSESTLPRYSSGARDELMQMQYLRATLEFWKDPENNPVSEVYGAPMIDMDRAHVWAWDARPYPWFPGEQELWSDSGNYARGHWITGRATSRGLDDVVREVCASSGVSEVETRQLYGAVRGYGTGDGDSARAVLQPLMLAYGFDAIERQGALVFRTRAGLPDRELATESLAVTSEMPGELEMTRQPAAETAGRLRLSFVEADGNYAARSVEAVFPDEPSDVVSSSDLSLVLSEGEGRRIVERWLAEARVARDTARFALPPSRLSVGAGDVVTLAHAGQSCTFRIDRVEQAEHQMLEAVRVERELYIPNDVVETPASLDPFVPPLPVFPAFLDLPLMTGEEVPHAPHLAIAARPWTGPAAVYASATDSDYRLDKLWPASATLGVTVSGLPAAPAGVVDRGPALRVRLSSGTLASGEWDAVLAGANALAIGTGADDRWEILQFADAALAGPNVYDLSTRLRGQVGTDALMPSEWPPGSLVVLLDHAVQQIELAATARGLARHYRIGAADRPYDDPAFVHTKRAFRGAGLRPYAPVHLKAMRDGVGGLEVNWLRRSRIDGDLWQGLEIPLGESAELYNVRVVRNGTVLRDESVASPTWRYSAEAMAADGVNAPFVIEVAQVSDRFGPGPYRQVHVDA